MPDQDVRSPFKGAWKIISQADPKLKLAGHVEHSLKRFGSMRLYWEDFGMPILPWLVQVPTSAEGEVARPISEPWKPILETQ